MENLKTLFNQLEDAHRKREDFMKARIVINNQVKAIERRLTRVGYTPEQIDAHVSKIILNENNFKEVEKNYEKQLVALTKNVPCVDWFCQFDGCAELSFAALIAETGDLCNYPNPAKVWKRMGLSVLDGRAEKNNTKGVNTGYSRRRRSIAYRLSSAIIKKQGKYRDVYTARKQYEIARDEAGYNKPYIDMNRDRLSMYKSPENVKRLKAGRLPLNVIDLRAQRYMVKQLIRDLWIEWNKTA